MENHTDGLVELLGLCCKRCGEGFGVCRSCYHGQRYCSEACRKAERGDQCRRAQARYMAQRRQRLLAAKAQAAYRERMKKGLEAARAKIVVDQGLDDATQTRDKPHQQTCCVRCKQRGRIVRWLN